MRTAKKDLKKVRDLLVEQGKDKAVDFACTAIEARTGLPTPVCRRAGEIVVKKLVKEVREKLSS